MGSIGWQELLIIGLIVVVLFGSTKLPELSRSLGRSARIFKSEIREMQKEDGDAKPADAPQAAPRAVAGEATADTSRSPVIDAQVEGEKPRD